LGKQHVIFETIHPFDDGNGRTGRIILSYLLMSAGYPPVILKGDDENKKKYYKTLEQADDVLRKLTTLPFSSPKCLGVYGNFFVRGSYVGELESQHRQDFNATSGGERRDETQGCK
jgi:hypothetical protein